MGLTRDQELRLTVYMAAHLEASDGAASVEQLVSTAMEACAIPAENWEAVARLAATLVGSDRRDAAWWRQPWAGPLLAGLADLAASGGSVAAVLGA